MALGHSFRGSRQSQEASNPCFIMLTSVNSSFNWLHKSDTALALPRGGGIGSQEASPAVGWAEDMGTSRASNEALQRRFPHEGLTGPHESSGSGTWGRGKPDCTPAHRGGSPNTHQALWAGSTLPLLPVLLSLLVSPLFQPTLLAGKLKGKTLPVQSDGCQAIPCVSVGR